MNLSLVKQDGSPAPSGIIPEPTSVSVGGSKPVNQPLTIKVASNVQTDTYNLKLKATGGNITKEASLTVTVRAQGQLDFDISLSPTSLTTVQGGFATTQLTITPKDGFSGTVSLSLVPAPPTGVELSPRSVEVGGSEVTKTLTIYTTADTPTGQHTLTLQATSGSIQKTTTLTLTVNKASEFTVNTEADTTDQTPGDGRCEDADGNCSLRAAVMEANALGAPVVINIPAGTYKLARIGNADEQGGDLDIKSNITLKGAGADQTILDGNGTNRVLEIHEGVRVRVEGVTIQNGKPSYYHGGGILNAGTLTLKDSTVSGNTTKRRGGGIYNDDGANLTLTNSTVSGNMAGGSGGGILNDGTLTLANSTVSGNTAGGSGGGIYNGYGATTILSFSTITLNQATSAGGGISTDSSTVKLKGVILAGNTSESGRGPECSGSLTSQGYNLIKSNADCSFTVQTTDITGQDPALGPLADNGGPTKTHLPQAGSPVLDKVPTGDCTDLEGNPLATDQRGVSRPQGNACDIGAVERRPSE